MRKNIIKILGALILVANLFSIPANALAPGWYKHVNVTEDIVNWEYVFPNGEHAVGWQYINGYWYYFWNGDCSSEVGMFTYNSEINAWIGGHPTMIDGKYYYFNTDSQLLVNTNIVQGSGLFVYHLDSNGHDDDSFEPYSLRYK